MLTSKKLERLDDQNDHNQMITDDQNDDNQDREERLTYLDQYSCRPPPFFLLALSFAQVDGIIMMT